MMLESRISTLFLAGGKTSLGLFEKVYQFLFEDNIVYGIITIVIIFALLSSIIKRAIKTNKDIEYSNSISSKEDIDRDKNHNSTMIDNSKYNNTTTKEMDYSSDLELVAVITAAIMAYMGEEAPEDGLIIRSIRKVNRRNHVNNYSD